MGFLDGLLGGQKPELQPADPRLAVVFAPPPDEPKFRKKGAEKALARESAAIMAILDSTGETCLIAAHVTYFWANSVIVVTDRRTFIIKHGKIERELSHDRVAQTELGSGTGGLGNTSIFIYDREGLLDYAPNDPKRFRHAICADVGSYRIGNTICGYIDQRVSG